MLFPRADGSVASLTEYEGEVEGEALEVTAAAAASKDVGSNSSSAKYSSNTAMDVVAQDDDVKNVSRSVLQRILKKPGGVNGNDDNEGAPLTTQAVRDLQRAQKERVYTRTLIRVK